MRILTQKEAKKIDINYIYNRGDRIAIISEKFQIEWLNGEWVKKKLEGKT